MHLLFYCFILFITPFLQFSEISDFAIWSISEISDFLKPISEIFENAFPKCRSPTYELGLQFLLEN